MTLDPRESGEFISENSKHVFIKKEYLPAVAEDPQDEMDKPKLRMVRSDDSVIVGKISACWKKKMKLSETLSLVMLLFVWKGWRRFYENRQQSIGHMYYQKITISKSGISWYLHVTATVQCDHITFFLPLCKRLKNKELRICSSLDQEHFPKGFTEEQAINYMFLLDAINFCFWPQPCQPQYFVSYNSQLFSGYFALCFAVKKACEAGIKMYDPATYAGLSFQQVKDIFRGENNVQIPLVEKRWECMKEVGNVLLDKYNGQFINCVLQVNKSAKKLLQLIVTDFPCFNDTATYRGKTVSLHKRAQIVVADVWSLYEGKGLSEFEDIDVITMFADYRVPQVLLSFGILQYSDDLMDKLRKSDNLLDNGSEEEVEIRGCSIRAVELLLEEMRLFMKREAKKEYYCNSIMIDNFLWGYRREHAERLSSLPYHKTPCIYY